MRPLNEIIVHASATRKEWWAGSSVEQKVAEFRRWHMQDRGWSNIGYHYVIDRDGSCAPGRPLEVVGAHVRGHNTGTIGICLVGGHGSSVDDDFLDNFTLEQDRALRDLVRKLIAQYGVMKLSGHNQYAAKACPGFRVADWWRSG